jgi:hypothetical protein
MTTSAELPTPAELEALEGQVLAASSAVETLALRLRRYADENELDSATAPLPTLADVGALWSFLTSTEAGTADLPALFGALRDLLSELDDLRLEAPGARAAFCRATSRLLNP